VKPEEALQRARDAAADARAGGAYADDLSGFEVRAPTRRTQEQMMEWAVIEPDMELVVSTRRWGAPITWLKRSAFHVLRQYLRQMESQQTRFNAHLLVRVAHLEDRLGELEEWAGRRDERLFGEAAEEPLGGSEAAAP
jgi:hypothetical protein